MLTLSNLGCNYILATSPELDDVISNPTLYDRVDILLSKNCCTTIYTESIDTPNLAQSWKATIPVSSTLRIQSVQIRNIVTGTLFSVSLSNTLVSSTSDLNVLTTSIDSYLDSHIGATSLTSTTTTASQLYTYTINGLPTGFSLVSITYTIDAVLATTPFSFLSSTNGSSLSGIGLYLSPEILNLSTFTDGVYHVTITAYKISGSRLSESNCLFVDCSTACQLSDYLEIASADDQVEALMLHYGLSNGSNCSCDCDTLCSLYQRLHNILNPTTTNCGC